MSERPAETAIVYHYFALYRLPIVRILTTYYERGQSRLWLYSSPRANVPSIKLIDHKLAQTPLSDGGLRWCFLKNIWIGPHLLWQVGLIWKVITNRAKVFVFLGNPYFLSTWVAALVARLCGKRVLFWTHGVTRVEKGWRRALRLAFYKLANGFLLYNNWAKKELSENFGLKKENLYVIYNSLDYDTHVKIRTQLSSSGQGALKKELFPRNPLDPALVFIGRVTRIKRLEQLLLAAKASIDDSFPVNILVIGDGPDLGRLRELSKNLGLEDRVFFRGACYDEEEIGQLLGHSDLCVVPGAIGLTAIHALSLGTPVITHDDLEGHGPEFEAVVQGVNGQVFKKDDVNDLTKVVTTWLRDHPDRGLVRQHCFQIIDRSYNPHVQSRIFIDAVNGVPASGQ